MLCRSKCSISHRPLVSIPFCTRCRGFYFSQVVSEACHPIFFLWIFFQALSSRCIPLRCLQPCTVLLGNVFVISSRRVSKPDPCYIQRVTIFIWSSVLYVGECHNQGYSASSRYRKPNSQRRYMYVQALEHFWITIWNDARFLCKRRYMYLASGTGSWQTDGPDYTTTVGIKIATVVTTGWAS